MIRHIFTIIRNEWKANLWIVVEYTLVFCILWFCSDYLYFIGKSYLEPLGFDIEHTYVVKMGRKNIDSETMSREDNYANSQILLDRIARHPAVESVGMSRSSLPYGMSLSINGFKINADSTWHYIQTRWVTPGFFDVFRIGLQSGRIPGEQDWSGNVAIITPDRHQLFGGNEQAGIPLTRMETLTGYEEADWQTVGVTSPLKAGFYDPYKSSIFMPLSREQTHPTNDIALRVRPEADRDFAAQFTRDMREQLMIGSYYLATVTPLAQLREIAMKRNGVTSSLNSVFSISAFLIVNIFLGIIGTFWYRTQARRGEIGLRMAMGATRRQVRTMLFSETLLLLFVASLIGLNVCLNINQTDLLQTLGIPRSNHAQAGIGMEQYIVNYALTFGFLAIVSLAAVWYPARQATRIPPVKALHEE